MNLYKLSPLRLVVLQIRYPFDQSPTVRAAAIKGCMTPDNVIAVNILREAISSTFRAANVDLKCIAGAGGISEADFLMVITKEGIPVAIESLGALLARLQLYSAASIHFIDPDGEWKTVCRAISEPEALFDFAAFGIIFLQKETQRADLVQQVRAFAGLGENKTLPTDGPPPSGENPA